jgi:hypothetical protein
MKKVLTARVGPDGVLALAVSLGEEAANRTVRVTLERLEQGTGPSTTVRTQDDWLHFIEATAGKWQGDLERPPQSPYEKRDDWP